MPVIAAYIGFSNITFLIVLSAQEYSIYHFPFVYSFDLYGHFIDEGSFYKEIFEFVKKKYKIPKGQCDILVCGHVKEPKINMEVKISAVDALVKSNITDFFPFLVNGLLSQFVYEDMETNLQNFLSNLSFCPQLLPNSQKNQVAIDMQLKIANEKALAGNEKPIIFSGNRFIASSGDLALTYLLALNLLAVPGIFEVKVDDQNILIPLTLLNLYNEKIYEDIYNEINFRSLGTLLNSPNRLECLFETEVGTSQFFEVDLDQLFFIPLDLDTRARILVKGPSFKKKCEAQVVGGDLGFIIDTREKQDSSRLGTTNILKLEVWEKQITEVLKKL